MTDYYIHPDGNDGWPGTNSKPYKTLARAVLLASNGDTIYMSAGTYSNGATIDKEVSVIGDINGKTIIDGNGEFPRGSKTLLSAMINITADNVLVSDISIFNSSVCGITAVNASNVVIDNVNVDSPSTNGIMAIDCNTVSITDSYVRAARTLVDLSRSDRRGAAMEIRGCNDVLIDLCNIYESDYQGLGIIQSSNVVITGNAINDNGGTQLYIDGASEVTVYDNDIFYTDAIRVSNRSFGIHIAREIYPLGDGASASSVINNSNIYIQRNFIIGCKSPIVHRGGFAIIYSRDQVGNVTQQLTEVPAYSWKNVNIFHNTFANSSGPVIIEKERDLYVLGTSGDERCTFVNNIVHSTGALSFQWQADDISTYVLAGNIFSSSPRDLRTLKNLSGCESILIGDPVLVNSGALIKTREDFNRENYKVRQSSPANGSAVSLIEFGLPLDAISDDTETSQFVCRGAHNYANNIDDSIVASFSISSSSGDVPHDVQFTDTSVSSKPIVKWSWTFGDGGVSNKRSPRHIYTRAGSFTVSLAVTDSTGLTVRETVQDAVVVSFDGVTPEQSRLTRVESSVVQITKVVGATATQAHNMNYRPKVLLISSGGDGSEVAFDHAELLWHVLTAGGESTSLGISSSIRAYSDGGDVTEATSQLNNEIRWFDGSIPGYRTLVFSWDENDIVIEDGTYGPLVDMNFTILAIGGPDMNYDMHEVSLGISGNGTAYNSGDIGFTPDVLLAWRDRQPVDSLSAPPTGYEWHMGFYSADNEANTQGWGTVNWVDTDWANSRGRGKQDRLFTLSLDTAVDGGVSAEIGNNSFNIWTTQDVATELHVLALDFGDLRTTLIPHETVYAAPSTQVDTVYDIGWRPQFILGFPNACPFNGSISGAGSLIHGIYVNDGIVENTHHIYAYSPYTYIGHNQLDLLGIDYNNSINQWYATVPFSDTGFTVQHGGDTDYSSSGGKSMLFVLESGSTDPIIAGFSVSSLPALAGVPLRVTNRTYAANIDDLVYEYTWDVDGESSDENPVITFGDVGEKEISLTVYSASNPNITDTYSINVTVVDNYVIPKIDIQFGSDYAVNGTVGQTIYFSDVTVPPTGTTIVTRDWVLRVTYEDVSKVVARSSDESFEFKPTIAGTYYVSLHLELDTQTEGTIEHRFETEMSYVPLVTFSVLAAAVQNDEMPESEYQALAIRHRALGLGAPKLWKYRVPATVRFRDTSDTIGKDIIYRQWVIAPIDMYKRINIGAMLEYADIPSVKISGGIWSFSGNDVLDFTFTEPGEYIALLILKTSGGVGYKYLNYAVVISERVQELLAPPGPAEVGAQSRSIIDGWGRHSHRISATVSGEPSKVVVTDGHGGIHAKYFDAIGGEDGVPAAVVNGRLDITGNNAEISGEDIVLNVNSLLPSGESLSQIGSRTGKFSIVHAGQVDAGQLAQVGNINSIGGSLFIGVSYRLLDDVTPETRNITITNGENLSSGDYIYLSRENTVEIMRVNSSPITTDIAPDSWSIAVLRGSEVADEYVSSAWVRGDTALNLGGSTTDTGDIITRSWIEVLADESIRSRLVDPGLAEGPVMVGSLRYGEGATDWFRYFAIGRLDGMYGVPDGVHKVGTVFGPDLGGVAYFMSSDEGLTIGNSVDGTIMRFPNAGGIEIFCATVEKAVDPDGVANRAIRFIHPTDERTTFQIGQTFDPDTRRAVAELYAPKQPAGWVGGIALIAEAPDGTSAELRVEGELDNGANIILVNVPTVDPGIEGALYLATVGTDTNVLRVSAG